MCKWINIAFLGVALCKTGDATTNRTPDELRNLIKGRQLTVSRLSRIAQLPQSSVDTFKNLLQDQSQTQLWANCVMAIGILATEKEIQYLDAYVETNIAKAAQHRHYLEAIMSVPTALEHAAARGSNPALMYLLKHSKWEAWKYKGGRDPNGSEKEHLMTMTILALARTGSPMALTRLEQMKDLPDFADQRHYIEWAIRSLKDLATNDLDLNRKLPP